MVGSEFVVKNIAHQNGLWPNIMSSLYSILQSPDFTDRPLLGCFRMGDSHHRQLTNLQQLCDAFMEIWSQLSEECFQHLVNLLGRFQRQEAVQPLQKH